MGNDSYIRQLMINTLKLPIVDKHISNKVYVEDISAKVIYFIVFIMIEYYMNRRLGEE